MHCASLTWLLVLWLPVLFLCPVQSKVVVDRPRRPVLYKSLHSDAFIDVTQKEIRGGEKLRVTEHTIEHKMTMTNLVVNIIADLCPHGMMPLAFGIAQGDTTGWAVAVALMGLFGSMSAYTMMSYADLSKATNTQNIGQIWSKLVNPRTAWAVDLSGLLLCFGCCVFYSAFIGDIFSSLVSAVGLTGLLAQRWMVLLSITLFGLLPLCLLEDLSALKFSSLVGMCGILYTAAFHALRLWDNSYAQGSEMLQYVSPKMMPTWPRKPLSAWKTNTGTLVLVNMLCVAFLAHYNSINYSDELVDSTPQRYNVAIAIGFGLSAMVFIAMMLIGYQLFGESAQPLLLNNFPLRNDILANVARAATGLAITFAYPLMFNGLKSSLYNIIEAHYKNSLESMPSQWDLQIVLENKQPVSLLHEPPNARLSAQTKQLATLGALATITAIAMQCGEEDVSVVLGIVGSVLGCFVAYILPGVLKIALQKRRAQAGLTNSRWEVVLNYGLVGMGLVFGALGTWITLKTEFENFKTGEHAS